MRPTSRHGVNKVRSAHHFKRNVQHTKAANLRTNPMRGGIRL